MGRLAWIARLGWSYVVPSAGDHPLVLRPRSSATDYIDAHLSPRYLSFPIDCCRLRSLYFPLALYLFTDWQANRYPTDVKPSASPTTIQHLIPKSKPLEATTRLS